MPAWNEILQQLQHIQVQAANASDIIRRQFLAQLNNHTQRNVIAYYSGFLSKPGVLQTEINGEDLNGFMMAVHKLPIASGVDLILHTPGGSISAAISIVHYLRKKFGSNIRAIVPQLAMSSGTMIACSCSQILMGKHSQLGPTDPHLNGIPAAGVIKEFRRACREVKRDPSRALIWQQIIGKYNPTFLSRCENAIKWSNTFVMDQLETIMFDGDQDANQKARGIVKALTDYSGNKSHDRPIFFDECAAIGLKVASLENNAILQDLVLSIHHCYMNAFMNGPAFKIIENHVGAALVKFETGKP